MTPEETLEHNFVKIKQVLLEINSVLRDFNDEILSLRRRISKLEAK